MTLPRSSDGLGKRLAKYRKLAGLSAQQLSDRLGGELSRSVIANIESGRKSDISIDQLLALAWVLKIPPVALAISAEAPFERINVVEGNERASLPLYDLAAWFTNRQSIDNIAGGDSEIDQAAAKLTQMMLHASASLSYDLHTLRMFERAKARGSKIPAENVEDVRAAIESSLKEMERANMDLDMTPEDEAWEERLTALLLDGPGDGHD